MQVGELEHGGRQALVGEAQAPVVQGGAVPGLAQGADGVVPGPLVARLHRAPPPQRRLRQAPAPARSAASPRIAATSPSTAARRSRPSPPCGVDPRLRESPHGDGGGRVARDAERAIPARAAQVRAPSS